MIRREFHNMLLTQPKTKYVKHAFIELLFNATPNTKLYKSMVNIYLKFSITQCMFSKILILNCKLSLMLLLILIIFLGYGVLLVRILTIVILKIFHNIFQ